MRKVQETGEDQITIGLWNTNTISSKKFPPMGYTITFNETEGTILKQASVESIPEFLERMSDSQRIYQAIKSNPRTSPRASRDLGINESTIRSALKKIV